METKIYCHGRDIFNNNKRNLKYKWAEMLLQKPKESWEFIFTGFVSNLTCITNFCFKQNHLIEEPYMLESYKFNIKNEILKVPLS